MFSRVLIILPLAAAGAAAQVPGAPVLQNAFANPGFAVAANFGSGTGQSYFGAAGAWGMGSGRIQLSGAAGAQRANGSTRGAYGGRVAASVWSSSGGALGLAGFAGVGRASSTRLNGVLTNPAVTNLPVGLTVGYRRPLGATRGLSAYVSPFYHWSRTDAGGTIVSGGTLRGALGLDFAFSPSLGITVGGDFGGKRGTTDTGLFGVGISFVPGRR